MAEKEKEGEVFLVAFLLSWHHLGMTSKGTGGGDLP